MHSLNENGATAQRPLMVMPSMRHRFEEEDFLVVPGNTGDRAFPFQIPDRGRPLRSFFAMMAMREFCRSRQSTTTRPPAARPKPRHGRDAKCAEIDRLGHNGISCIRSAFQNGRHFRSCKPAGTKLIVEFTGAMEWISFRLPRE